MSLTGLIIVAVAGVIALILVVKRVRAKLANRAFVKLEARRLAIKPSLSFYLKSEDPSNREAGTLYLQNMGQGRALDISIKDFHHPQEKDWTFKFEKTGTLEPGEQKEIDFKFMVGDYEASNKYEQLWMFDPEHDHDFAANIILSCSDVDGDKHEKTITIGENKKPKVSRSQLIGTLMSPGRLK